MHLLIIAFRENSRPQYYSNYIQIYKSKHISAPSSSLGKSTGNEWDTCQTDKNYGWNIGG